MSYFKFSDYEVKPVNSFNIIRNCSGCGCKAVYVNTNHFRVNANGNSLDIWLIYQCVKCKHTYNLPIYERVRPKSIEKATYQKFLENNLELAFEYGSKIQLLQKNKAEIEKASISYDIIGGKKVESGNGKEIVIRNPYGLKLRIDKILSEITGLSRSRVMEMITNRRIIFEGKNLAATTIIHLEETDELSL